MASASCLRFTVQENQLLRRNWFFPPLPRTPLAYTDRQNIIYFIYIIQSSGIGVKWISVLKIYRKRPIEVRVTITIYYYITLLRIGIYIYLPEVASPVRCSTDGYYYYYHRVAFFFSPFIFYYGMDGRVERASKKNTINMNNIVSN